MEVVDGIEREVKVNDVIYAAGDIEPSRGEVCGDQNGGTLLVLQLLRERLDRGLPRLDRDISMVAHRWNTSFARIVLESPTAVQRVAKHHRPLGTAIVAVQELDRDVQLLCRRG